MAELKTLYEELGFKNVTTYIQSGNVVFSTDEQDMALLTDKIHKSILKKYGFNVPIIVRTIKEMQTMVDKNPLVKRKDIDTGKLHVTFLSACPDQDHLQKIKEYQYMPDEYMIVGKEVLIYCPNGYGNTKLANTFFENKLKVTATTRNWRTVNELLRIGKTI